MVYRNNAGRLGSGSISVCLETRWLGPKSRFYVPERPCSVSIMEMGKTWFLWCRCTFSFFLFIFLQTRVASGSGR